MFKQMPELTREEKIKIFEKLPKELQNLMQSEDTGAFLLYLGKKYNLANDKIHQLSRLVGDVVLGIIPVTSLAQEINSKIATDSQIAMSLAQELYTDLLSPVMSKNPTSPQASVGVPAPQPVTPIPTPRVGTPTLPPTNIGADRYRELTNGAPGIVDLRKAPLTFTKPIERASLIEADPHKTPPMTPTLRPPVSEVGAPTPAKRGVGVEAEPHRQQQPATLPAEKPMTNILKPPVVSEVEPQYIIRPPGLAPTDIPHNILDLKKDKGEF